MFVLATREWGTKKSEVDVVQRKEGVAQLKTYAKEAHGEAHGGTPFAVSILALKGDVLVSYRRTRAFFRCL